MMYAYGMLCRTCEQMLDTAAYVLEDCSALVIEAAQAAAAASQPASNGTAAGVNGIASPTPAGAAPLGDVGGIFSRLKVCRFQNAGTRSVNKRNGFAKLH